MNVTEIDVTIFLVAAVDTWTPKIEWFLPGDSNRYNRDSIVCKTMVGT